MAFSHELIPELGSELGTQCFLPYAVAFSVSGSFEPIAIQSFAGHFAYIVAFDCAAMQAGCLKTQGKSEFEARPFRH